PLLDHYLASAARELNQRPKRMDAAVRERLADHDWPGNVRELVNLCRRLSVLVPGPEIQIDDLPMRSAAVEDDAWTGALARWAGPRLARGEPELLPEAVRLLEQCLIDQALRLTGGRRAEAARLLGIGRNTLTRKTAPGSEGG
ncbi:MAG: helix-turn-helix domain-containing protein, partial [Wenzhouxiangellaceae bacterium]